MDERTAKIQSTFLFILVIVALGAVFRMTGEVMIPFVVALLFSFVFTPVMRFFERLRFPYVLAVVVLLALFLGVMFLVALFVYSSVNRLVDQFPEYQKRFIEIVNSIVRELGLPSELTDQFNWMQTLGSSLVSVSGSFVGFVGSLLIVLVFLLFLLLEKPYLRPKLGRAFGTHRMRRIVIIFAHINRGIGRYLAVKLFASGLTAVIVYVAFSAIGVDFPFVWASLTFVFNFIPSIGSIFITIAAILFAIVQFFPAWDLIILTGAIMLAAQLIIGNVVDPQMQGDNLNLSPVVIIFALFFFGWLWGIIGMFLSVPLTVAVKICFEHIPALHPAAALMGAGRYKKRRRRQVQSAEKANSHRR